VSYAFLLFVLVLFQATFLYRTFNPGFLSPDVVLSLLLLKVYLKDRYVVLWAAFGGLLLDLLADTLGLNLFLYVLSVYLLSLFYGRFLFVRPSLSLVPPSLLFLLKKALAILLMRTRFSFDIPLVALILSWLVEVLLISGLYFIYLRRRE